MIVPVILARESGTRLWLLSKTLWIQILFKKY